MRTAPWTSSVILCRRVNRLSHRRQPLLRRRPKSANPAQLVMPVACVPQPASGYLVVGDDLVGCKTPRCPEAKSEGLLCNTLARSWP